MSVSIPAARARSFSSKVACVLRAFCQQPIQVATLVPSSRRLIETVADRECIRTASTVVELGPGAGGTTEGLLGYMEADSTLLAIEKTTMFEAVLNEIYDPRLRVEIEDATKLLSLMSDYRIGCVDVVVSGIPFSSLPDQIARKITQSVFEALKPGGTFIAYQLHDDVKDYALPLFGPPSSELVRWNLPPLNVYTWKKVVAADVSSERITSEQFAKRQVDVATSS